MPDPGFDAVVSFLEDGALGGPVERVDTHAAIVLLAGGRAFKLKRPVRYSFLDFTTLAAREAALRHELEPAVVEIEGCGWQRRETDVGIDAEVSGHHGAAPLSRTVRCLRR